MKTLVLRSGFKHYEELISLSERLDWEQAREFEEQLYAIAGLSWKEANRIWILPCMNDPKRAPGIWAMYDAMGLEDHVEQGLLKNALKPLLNDIRELYKWAKRNAPKPPSKESPQEQ